MPKNIVVFSDGTGQEGGLREEQRLSNVYKLYRVCRLGPDSGIDPQEQVAFYDAGLGTDAGATGFTGAYRRLQKLLSSVTGLGITRNIADCYAFIINHWEPGDRIFLIGFSRGAYTARCVANVLFLCGIPTKAKDGPLLRFRKAVRDIADEAVMKVYEYGAGSPRGGTLEEERFALARRFRKTYGSGDALRSNAAPHFIGVFDTVASLGSKGPKRWGLAVALVLIAACVAAVPAVVLDVTRGTGFVVPFIGVIALIGAMTVFRWLPTSFKSIQNSPVDGKARCHIAQWRSGNYDRLLSGHVGYARHALALDETRADFPRVEWGSRDGVRKKVGDEPEPLVQMWFAGNHSDVGGSYPEAESRLSDIALEWMVQEATSIPGPLVIDGKRSWQDGTGRLRLHPAHDGMQHCEVVGMRDTVAGIVPRWSLRAFEWVKWPVEDREPDHDAPVHPSVHQRFALPRVTKCADTGPYRPTSLSLHDDFKASYPPSATEPQPSPSWLSRVLAWRPWKAPNRPAA
ncbi:DUF2235 domain-containing protein [Methylobacterium sp.]|uniref:DUF2235 domain-containing protein n=1 Tax=Methylobacterium sp. TaxID=409 RepID=UPI003B01FD46